MSEKKLCHRTIQTGCVRYCNGGHLEDDNGNELSHPCRMWVESRKECLDIDMHTPVTLSSVMEHECNCKSDELPGWLKDKFQDLIDGVDAYIESINERIKDFERFPEPTTVSTNILLERIKIELAMHRRAAYQKVLDSKP